MEWVEHGMEEGGGVPWISQKCKYIYYIYMYIELMTVVVFNVQVHVQVVAYMYVCNG